MLLATAAGKGAVTLEEIAAAGGVTLEQAAESVSILTAAGALVDVDPHRPDAGAGSPGGMTVEVPAWLVEREREAAALDFFERITGVDPRVLLEEDAAE